MLSSKDRIAPFGSCFALLEAARWLSSKDLLGARYSHRFDDSSAPSAVGDQARDR